MITSALSPLRVLPPDPDVPAPAALPAAGSPWWLVVLAVVLLAAAGALLWWLRMRRAGHAPADGVEHPIRAGSLPAQRVHPERTRWKGPARSQRPATEGPPPGARLVNPHGADELTQLIEMGPRLASRLVQLPVELALPQRPVLDEQGELVGVRVAPPEPAYLLPGKRGELRTLDRTLGREGPGLAGLSLEVRLEFGLSIGYFLHELHRLGWAYGAICWESFALRADASRLRIGNVEMARRIGGEPACGLVTDPSWADPRNPSGVATFEQDRYQYALLMYRLVISGHPQAALSGSVGVPALPGWSPALRRRTDLLLQRAASPALARPAVVEWLEILNPQTAAPTGMGVPA